MMIQKQTIFVFATVLGFPCLALADFKGGDTFEKIMPSNWFFNGAGGGDFFNDSRLEFRVNSPATYNSATLTWMQNEGGYAQSWFMQVDVAIGAFAFPDQDDGIELGLGVFPSEDRGFRLVSLGMNHFRDNGLVRKSIAVQDTRSYYQERDQAGGSATLRLHYDKSARTITPSWNTGNGWEYGGPRDLIAWNMKPAETFRAVVVAKNGATSAGNAKVLSGKAWFKNFKTGNASPDVVVERSSSTELKSKQGTVSFGAAKTDFGKVIKTFKIRNHGTAELKSLKLSVLGADAKDFSVSNLAKVKLLPGSDTTFKIAFSPRHSGASKANVFLTSNDPDESAFQIKVSGRGVD